MRLPTGNWALRCLAARSRPERMSNTAYARTSTAGTVVVGAAVVLGADAVVGGASVVVGAAVVGGAVGVVAGARVVVGAAVVAGALVVTGTVASPGSPPSVAVVPAPRSELHPTTASAAPQSTAVIRRGFIASNVPVRGRRAPAAGSDRGRDVIRLDAERSDHRVRQGHQPGGRQGGRGEQRVGQLRDRGCRVLVGDLAP